MRILVCIFWAIGFGVPLGFCSVITVPGQQPTIQAGIDAAVNGDTVLVADGVYTGDGNRDIDFLGKAITVRSESGPDNCVILCEGTLTHPHRGFIFQNDETRESIVQGFTIKNGVARGIELDSLGGGMFVHFASPTISNCVFWGNRTGSNGSGGGLCCRESNSTITDCIFISNSSSHGGALTCQTFTSDISNCLFVNNLAVEGGALSCWEARLTIANCSFVNNASGFGGAIFYSEANVSILNSILWGNSPNQIDRWFGSDSMAYSNCMGGYPGLGNINDDPGFVAGPSGSYYLSQISSGQNQDSPCVNAGNMQASESCYSALSGDFCMSQRSSRSDELPDNGPVDMGFHYVTPYSLCVRHGDVDLNGQLTSIDAQLAFEISQSLLNPTPEQWCAADCNGSDSVTSRDAQNIMLTVLGLSNCVDAVRF